MRSCTRLSVIFLVMEFVWFFGPSLALGKNILGFNFLARILFLLHYFFLTVMQALC